MSTPSLFNIERDKVWMRIAKECPWFKREMDITDNYHTVQEIVLSGSPTWARANEMFVPGENTRVMDVGANVGIYTAYCAARGAWVHAYEPSPLASQLLRMMLTDAKLSHMVAQEQSAIWIENGEILYSGNTNLMNSCVWHNGSIASQGINEKEFVSKEKVRCISFDEAIGDHEWDMVKMDIEGAEFEVLLATHPAQLLKIRNAYIEFHPWAPKELYDDTIARLQTLFNFQWLMTNEKDPNRCEACCLRSK